MSDQKRAFITGIGGQDGSYLAEYLHGLGYKVYGLVRYSTTRDGCPNLTDLSDDIEIIEGDLTDQMAVSRIIRRIKPHEVYNLAAQSHVGKSFEYPQFTADVTAMGVIHLLEAIRQSDFYSKFYQASTSELFGNAEQSPQHELTPFHPRSPYAVSKLFAHHMVRVYRESYNMFACSGILFNHESPRRGDNFVTQKVCKAAAKIALGDQSVLELGNLDARRDWGHARDYVRGMHAMLQHTEPDDFVLATGKSHSIRDLLAAAFSHPLVNLNPDDFVQVNPKFFRPAEVHTLMGDASKAKRILGWEPETSFEEMIHEMVTEQFNKASS